MSKAFGGALAAYFAAREGIEAVAVRIGAFERPEIWQRLDTRQAERHPIRLNPSGHG